MKTGRAALLPAFDGTYERQRPDLVTGRAEQTYTHAENASHWVKDLRRSVDYLESRPDIDPERIGYIGTSWGGRLGAIMLVMEPRLRAGVLYLGGFRPERALPVADDLNFVPRVRQPVLMINGREDHLRPLELSQLLLPAPRNGSGAERAPSPPGRALRAAGRSDQGDTTLV